MGKIGTQEAAERLGVSQRRVVALIRDGRLKARKIGPVYVIDERSLETVRERKPGRPAKKS